ncbi:MAG: glycoside hydrolase family 2 protein, partial [Crocinitomicaceae bacterium]
HWEYRSVFNHHLTSVNTKTQLNFELVDTYASIYLNDSLILTTNNFFRPYSVDITKYLKEGRNELKAIFTPPVLYHYERYKKERFHYPAPNDLAEISIAPLTRKPQYHFGWDWAPRINTLGFLKPVRLIEDNKNSIVNKQVQTLKIAQDTALLAFKFRFSYKIDTKSFQLNCVDFMADISDLKFDNDKTVSFKMKIPNPRLWWPKGYGSQNLYDIRFIVDDNFSLNQKSVSVRFGIRTAELVTNQDKWGTSYYFKINNKPIFCKGGDYIPQDILHSRVSNQAIEKMIQAMVDANFNTVRVWGGGYYPDDYFYERCDELGLMVWQDLMFACSMYPGDSSFLKSVSEEFDYQLPRILTHPSVILINGNNEVDVAWKNWGFQLKYGIYGADASTVEKAYDTLFKRLAPSKVGSYGLGKVSYIHTSPTSNWGKDDYFNHGSMHYWGVWHGKDPIEDFGIKSGRFNAEYGFQSFPELATILKFSDSSMMDLNSSVMKHHQKSYVGNGMIKKHSDLLYGKTDDFKQFIYFSQLTQSKAVEIAIAGHRTNMPKCMGTLYWQVNDCWPGPTWSSIDYYGNWKALHYKVRQSYQDVVVLEKTEKIGEEQYILVYNLPDSANVSCHFEVKNLVGETILNSDSVYNLKPFDSKVIINKSFFLDYTIDDGLYFAFEINVNDKIYKSNFSSLDKNRTKPAEESFNYFLKKYNETNELILTIENSLFLKDFWITYPEIQIFTEENFIDLLPGKHQFKIKPSDNQPLNLEGFEFYWR